MGLKNFSIFTIFKAKDGVTPVFKHIIKNGNTAGLSISRSMSKARLSILALKSACVTVTGAIAAVGAFAPLKAFSDWEKGITTVYTLLNKNEINTFGKTLKELSKEGIRAGLGIEDVNKALFDSVSAMGMSEKTINVYKKSLILAKGGVADVSTALGGMMSVINAWGEKTTNATEVANAFFTAQKKGVTTVEELASNIGQVAPLAKQMGLSVEETLSTIAALTTGGLSTDMAATGLKNTLQALANPTENARKTLEEFGVPFGIVDIKAKGLTYTLQKLIEMQQKSPNAITKAIPNIRALTTVLSLDEDKMQKVHKTLVEIQEDVKNGTGLNEAFEMMNSTGAATMSKVMGELQIALIELGKLAAPVLLPVVKGFGDLVHWLNEMLPKLSKVGEFLKNHSIYIISIVSGISGMLALKTSVNAVTTALKWYNTVTMIAGANGIQAVTGLKKLCFVLGGYTSALWKSIIAIKMQTLALLGNPWTWVAIGIGLVVAGVILLYKNWDKVTEAVKNWYNTAKTKVLSFWEKTKEVFSNIGNYIKTHFIELLFSALNPIGAIIMGLKNVLKLFGIIKSDESIFKNGFKMGIDNNNYTAQPYVKYDNITGSKAPSGLIEVKNIVENKNNSSINSSVSLMGANNLQLKPI
ncbi:phage tail tape measure protein [bacterium]|nr:phage tail tape measure protein [bacterium]